MSPLPRRVSARRVVTALAACLALAAAGCAQVVDGHPHAAGSGPIPPTNPFSPGAGSPPATGGSTAPVQPAQFTSCDQLLHLSGVSPGAGLAGKLAAQCAHLPVPLDYSAPTGKTIDLQLVKIHDSDDTHPIGTLLINPGGPGGSGVELALGLLSQISPDVLQHFDLLGFDPRGVSLSSPIRCISDSQKDQLNAASPDITTPAGFAAAKRTAKSFDDACEQKYGSALPFYDTVNTARDMDRIRAAVGDPKMNYLGFSYGTELGSVYAHLFPHTVRVAVLDGAVDPLTNGTQQFADQLKGFEGAFDQFAQNCDAASACPSLSNPRATAEQVEAAAEQSPLHTDSGRDLTASLASTGILEALYSKSLWPQLATALVSAKTGNGTGLLALADQYNERQPNGQYSNLMDANTAISCNDSPPGPSDAAIRATATRWTSEFPLFGKWAAISLFTCQQWQPVRHVPPKPTAPTSTKVLVIGNLHDPATPYQGAKDLTSTMGNAELLSWDGEGHTSYLQGSSCIDKYVNGYLVSETLPPADTTCPK